MLKPPANPVVSPSSVLHRFAAWPLSAQVIAALALALLPLGILALIAAFDSYSDVRASQARLAAGRLDTIQRGIESSLETEFVTLQALLLDGVSTPDMRASCDMQLTRLAQVDNRIASIVRVDSAGRLLCASAGARLPQVPLAQLQPAPPTGWGRFSRALLVDEAGPERDLVLAVRDMATEGEGNAILARMPRTDLATLLPAEMRSGQESVQLRRFGEQLAQWGRPISGQSNGRNFETITDSDGRHWLRGGRQMAMPGLEIDIATPATRIALAQALAISLPALMWLAAVLIAWLAIDRLVVTPLKEMRQAMVRYGGGDVSVRVGSGRFVTQEMSQLGTAFDRMADQIHGHEGELRDSLATQKKLTREVHHRVKNNLQIVSSLLSLQSRDAASPEVAHAYSTIQQRVNALALVHRWLYDDEAMKGVDLRSLMQDLCAGLEQSVATQEGTQVALTPDVERFRVPQDTAVPLAFLVTELVTAAARLAAGTAMAVRVMARSDAGRGKLVIEAVSFRGVDTFAPGHTDPTARIAQGMARQMRTRLVHDAERGSYEVEFPTA